MRESRERLALRILLHGQEDYFATHRYQFKKRYFYVLHAGRSGSHDTTNGRRAELLGRRAFFSGIHPSSMQGYAPMQGDLFST